MILNVEWVKASRPPIERDRISLTFRNAVLDFFNGVENAERAYSLYIRAPHKPFQDWPYAYHNAFRYARPYLTAWEIGHSSFKITFIKERALK